MEVHQPFRLLFGLFVAAGGSCVLFGSLYQCWKSRRFLLEARQPTVTGIVFVAVAAHDLSRAFDWPHQESHRTVLIEWLSLPIVFIGLALIFLLRRAEKKARAELGIIAPGEHKA